ncbi:MAG: hypothetical protein AAF446_01455 [Pseudomonadota bacterium]
MSTTECIALIRCAPGSAESDRLNAWLEHNQGRPGLLFFQADGVEHAASAMTLSGVDSGHFRMAVCEGSWKRRFDHKPPTAFAVGSLVDLLARLDGDGVELECFSAGR